MSRSIATSERSAFLLAVLLSLLISTPARATNLSTGDPCNLVTTAFEREAIFLDWFAPPAMVAVLSGIASILAIRRVKRSEQQNSLRLWGTFSGVLLAATVTSGVTTAAVVVVHFLAPAWLY